MPPNLNNAEKSLSGFLRTSLISIAYVVFGNLLFVNQLFPPGQEGEEEKTRRFNEDGILKGASNLKDNWEYHPVATQRKLEENIYR